MTIYTPLTILFLGVLLNPTIATYTSEEDIESSKMTYGSVNSVFSEREASRTQNRHSYNTGPSTASQSNVPGNYFNGAYGSGTATDILCSAVKGCSLPLHRSNGVSKIGQSIDEPPRSYTADRDSSATNGAGQIDTRADSNIGTRGQYYPYYPQPYPQPYPPAQFYYPPGQIDPGFARFPPPQYGGPMPNYVPQPQGGYPQPQWPYGPPPTNSGPYTYGGSNHPYQYYPENKNHHNDQDHYHQHHPESRSHNVLDHSLKTNTEYTEVGHHENNFQGNSNGLGYGAGYNGAFNRPPY